MDFLICLLSLLALMWIAYKGFSVILFAPVCAIGAVLLTDPMLVAPLFSGVFMDKMVIFVRLYFPVFLLGAIFGKCIELAGFSKAIVAWVVKIIGPKRTILSIVLVCSLMTYGGVSVFVAVFAVYPFAAEMFKASGIPKRLIPATIALGAFTFTMFALPGTPQIQNIIPTSYFKTDAYAAPWLGTIGGMFIFAAGLIYLEWRRKTAQAKGEGYGNNLKNEPEAFEQENLPNPFIAILPMFVVGVGNMLFTSLIPAVYGKLFEFTQAGSAKPVVTQIGEVTGIWAVEAALLCGIAVIFVLAFNDVSSRFTDGARGAISGALLALFNTASGYGYGAVISGLSGFLVIKSALMAIPNPLINEAITITTLAGITGSASGGMSIAAVHRGRRSGQYSAGSFSPGGFNGLWRHGHAAAQWRRHYTADGNRHDAQGLLRRHLRPYGYQDKRSLRYHRRVLSYRPFIRVCVICN